MAERLQIRLLGQPHFAFDGERFRFGALPKSQALLAYLLVRREVAVSRDTLAFTLWPDDSEEEAAGKLRRHLYDLTRALPRLEGVAWLLAERDAVQWNGGAPAWLDMDAFERLVSAPETRAEAVELYRGDLLENLYDDWLFPERERLRALFLDALRDLAHTYGARREFDRALGYATRFLQHEPWREDVLREQMILQYQSGDRAGALYAFEDFSARLQQELGAGVMPETVALRDAMLTDAAVALDARRPEPASAQRTDSNPLSTGTRRQFDQLRAAWQRAARGRGNAVFINGESGTGKSRLAAELLGLARRQGGRVLAGVANAAPSGAYAVVAGAFEAGSPFAGTEGTKRSGKPGDFESYSAHLRTVSRDRPTLVLLEDVNRCDEQSLDLIEHLARAVAELPVLLVVTCDAACAGSQSLLAEMQRALVAGNFASAIALTRLDPSVFDRIARYTPLIGRDEEIAYVKASLEESRLLTILGAGGVGKTRVALQVAADLSGDAFDNARFVDLATVAESGRVLDAVAGSLGVDTSGGDASTMQNLLGTLQDERLLLVLDNCEHVLEASAALAERISGECRGIKILATSREPLRSERERTYRLPSLAHEEAVALFAARARAAQPGFTITAANESAIDEIARRLDGIPLAIELAAARISVLTPAEIARHLDERFALLAAKSTAVPRHRTLRAALEWSYDLLPAREQALLRQCAVFRGGWTLEAVNAVCAADSGEKWDVLELLAALVEKSLVVANTGDSERRFHLLESTREYALERLRSSEGGDGVARRHCAFFCRQAAHMAQAQWTTNLNDWIAEVRADLANYRAGIDWGLIAGNDVDSGTLIVTNLWGYWFYARAEGTALLDVAEKLLDASTSHATRAKVLVCKAQAFEYSGNVKDAAREALALFTESGDAVGRMLALGRLASAALAAGEVDDAIRVWLEQEQAARETGLTRIVAGAVGMIGLAHARAGDLKRARDRLEEAVAIYRSFGDEYRSVVPLGTLAEVAAYDGDFRAAIDAARAVLEVATRAGDERALCNTEANIAAYYLELGEAETAWPHARLALERAQRRREEMVIAVATIHMAQIAAVAGGAPIAAQLLGYADAIYRSQGTQRELTEQRSFERAAAAARETLGLDRFDEFLEQGAALDAPGAAALAASVQRPIPA